jgi:hypothetical protein
LNNLGTECIGSGTCVTQKDSSTGSWNTCYDNGAKEIVVHDIGTDDRTMTLKMDSSTCFSTVFNGNDVYNGGGAITVRNDSGDTLGSVTIGYEDRLYRVTCTGGQEVVLAPSCEKMWPISVLMGTTCADGACQP